ncbi:MAG: hypothetical protein D6698_10000 [Gammaproteobacteria bacterium]|nr:MAG: hypothetical protein D6698_10000 [Gammaproteobacteria bacterium]
MTDILCVPSHTLSNVQNGADLKEVISNNYTVLERNRAETDENYRQIIPYVVFYDNRPTRGSYLVYRRSGSESRLHQHWSMGFGGHVDVKPPIQDPWKETYIAALREVDEELCCGGFGVRSTIRHAFDNPAEKIIPIILHDTPVDRVHVGLGILCFVPIEDLLGFSLRGDEGRDLEVRSAYVEAPNFESWSWYMMRSILWL